MKRIISAVAAFALLSGVATSADAQQRGGSAAKAPSPKPQIIIQDRDLYRGPPVSPATRPYPPPRPEIGRPMDPLPPLPEMKPRVGD